MKKIIFLSFFIGLIGLAACNKDDDTGSNGDCALSAKVDGTDWCGSANFTVTDLGPAGVVTSVGAGNANMEAIGLQFFDNKTGTFDLSNSVANWTVDGKAHLSTSGTLTVSKFENDKISGTFNFEAQATDGTTVSVTDGEFNDLEMQ